MKELRLIVNKRTFPSHGRVRINVHRLPDLEIARSDRLDLINEDTGKSISVAIIADSMVAENEIRISEEDLEALRAIKGDKVLVRKTLPMEERVMTAVKETENWVAGKTEEFDSSLRETAGEIMASAGKTTETIKKEAGNAGIKVKKAFARTQKKGKHG